MGNFAYYVRNNQRQLSYFLCLCVESGCQILSVSDVTNPKEAANSVEGEESGAPVEF
jgi:hypothetical protein